MNKRDKSIEDFKWRMRELLSESNDGVIARMQQAADEMLGPAEEPHECWFESYGGHNSKNPDWREWWECKGCREQRAWDHEELHAMYNAMRHLTPELLEDAMRHLSPMGLFTSRYTNILRGLRAAVKALRKASKSE